MTDPTAFRGEFPVLERVAYLNAGTDGPVPRRGAEAALERTRLELEAGRSGSAYMKTLSAVWTDLRATVAALLNALPAEIALTHSTTDGVNTVIAGLDLPAGGEILTSDEEHPGLLAPLAYAERRRGVRVRAVPFGELAASVSADTLLVACSHVSWASGQVVDADGLRATGVPVLLDGAQGLGAVPVDVRALGCDFYAASGQKWLCGPDGIGYLYVREERVEGLHCPWPNYLSLSEPARAMELPLHASARRFDLGVVPGPPAAWALESLKLLEETGWEWVHERSRDLAAGLAAGLESRGLEVLRRGPSTLVTWRAEKADAVVERLAREDIVVRNLPDKRHVRASVGAWSSEEELERLAVRAAA